MIVVDLHSSGGGGGGGGGDVVWFLRSQQKGATRLRCQHCGRAASGTVTHRQLDLQIFPSWRVCFGSSNMGDSGIHALLVGDLAAGDGR